ncbi:MAG: B12-binding domain-containing radical SAM protein [Myxococcus sp.]|nr:B12-binding domain-containing radical SAM protein [Myxococcus sp.]
MTRKTLKLVQLPVPPPAAFAATGNVPLAAGCLGVAAQVHGFSDRYDVEVVAPSLTDSLGDTQLAERLAASEPDVLGLSLYLWNVERSLHLAREVKRRAPRTLVMVGGPEVSDDNEWLRRQPGYDVAVAGEGEEALADLLERSLDRRALAGLPGVSVRTPDGSLTPFGPKRAAKFALSQYASPYLAGLVPVEPERSVYVEGARGCRSKCTFCFYPKAESGLRLLDPSQVEALVRGLRERGAKELSFLDPTFNHRPDFELVLEALIRANPNRELSFFAEVRPEGLSAKHAAMLAQAGFTRLELGLQSVSAKTLKRVKRGGNPAMVAAAAKLMRSEGIDLLLDLIVGLPGDTADDVARGVDYLEKHQLGAFAQVFALFVLPGTAMRDTALEDGLVFEPEPPYRIIRTATMDERAIADALSDAEARLGRRLEARPRPHLVDAGPLNDVFRLDLDTATGEERALAARAGAQQVALWLEADDLFERRAAAREAIAARQAIDPYATLDVVLVPRAPFPLDLLDVLTAQLAAGTKHYETRARAHRSGGDVARLSVVLSASAVFPEDWVEALRGEVPVFREQPLSRALADAERLGDSLPCARVTGPLDAAGVARLEALADPEGVVFADRAAETHWQRAVLGYGDAGA